VKITVHTGLTTAPVLASQAEAIVRGLTKNLYYANYQHPRYCHVHIQTAAVGLCGLNSAHG